MAEIIKNGYYGLSNGWLDVSFDPQNYYKLHSFLMGEFYYEYSSELTQYCRENMEQLQLASEGHKIESAFLCAADACGTKVLVFYSQTSAVDGTLVLVKRCFYRIKPGYSSIKAANMLPEIEKLNSYGQALPDIFHTPYGTLFLQDNKQFTNAAIRGLNLQVKSVFQPTHYETTQPRQGEYWYVQMEDYSVTLAVVDIESGYKDGRFKLVKATSNKIYNWPLYKLWIQNEGLKPDWSETSLLAQNDEEPSFWTKFIHAIRTRLAFNK